MSRSYARGWLVLVGVLLLGLSLARGDDVTELTQGNTRFAFDLYGVLREEEGNLFYAPHSLSVALAMTYGGARGETERQMAEALGFTLPQERLHEAFAALDGTLADREGLELNVANALWGQRDYGFLPAFLELLADAYGAGLEEVDFAASPEEARETINRWVEGETEGRIENLLPEGSVTPLTRLILANAVYFKAAWQHPFEEALTEEAPFTLPDGGEVMAPTMRQTERFGYARLDNAQAIELPYQGETRARAAEQASGMSMLVLLPDEGAFEAFEAELSPATLEEALEALRAQEIDLFMPKFSYRSSFSLRGALSELGMAGAFSEGADFSGMNGQRDLFIHDVVHQAFVLVDEEGTEAAAATGVVVGVTAVGPEPLEVRIDRPFIYLIRDGQSGAVLFMGRVLDPRS
jgi:serpin B